MRFLSVCVVVGGVVACSPPPSAPPSQSPADVAEKGPAAESGEPGARSGEAAVSGSAKPATAAAPSAELSGAVLKLSHGGGSYALTESKVYTDKDGVSLRFEQPMKDGYNQLWLNVNGAVTKGKPAKIEGVGMSGAFLQLAKGSKDTQNVSNSCSTSGSVTFEAVPKAGAKATGALDVTITCREVDALSGPLVVKGRFEGVPVKKFE